MHWNEEFKSDNIMDSIFEDIKEKIYENLKDDIKQKIVTLEDNNKWLNSEVVRLQDELDKYKSEERNIKYDACCAKLSELFKDVGMVNVLYSINWRSSYKKKCDKCDDNRRLHYKTPRGKDAVELCECGEYKKMFYPVENELVRFTLNKWRSDAKEHPMFLWFSEINCETEEFSNERCVKHIYNNESYEEIFEKFGEYNSGLLFKSKDECQNYCDWLSKKFGWTSDMIYSLSGNEIRI